MPDAFALYVHVPWCRHVCPYCAFNVYAAAAPPEAEYRAALARELAAHAAGPPWHGRRVKSVYFGGGTPSLFSPAAIGAVIQGVERCLVLEADAEVTLEANPGTVSRETLVGYRAAGVNRLSLGAQSFHPRHLETLGRDHALEETPAAVAATRAAGFGNLSLDVIYGVPGQTLAELEADLAAIVALEPEHVSAYALTWEPGTPFQRWREAGRMVPVDEDLEAVMGERVAAVLDRAGYARYEVSSFARPGFTSRHNTSYWDGSDYLGIGAGAHSFAADPPPGRRWVNERRPEAYGGAVAARATAIAHEARLTVAQARGEFCFAGLRRTAGVDLAAFRRRFGLALSDAFPHVAGLTHDGLVEVTDDRLRLTAQGLRFADTVSATFV